ncbi:hypothetical protein FKW77_009124 [Venturia effusa]|uniref:Uncharacterized protein n=1 Tax=Venturia effusa TaxID=50376 RepID=A0A517LCW9_9PEZI|nr:hypothetical protein FKW77_009124 [Venturia effusa]
MVHLSKFLTVVVAGSSVASASNTVRRSAGASAQADAKDAVASLSSLLAVLSNSIGSDGQLDGAELKTAFQGYVKTLQSVSNVTAEFSPNWEGAAMGGAAMAIQGLVTGALMGMTTQWTFAGLNSGIKAATGIDPMELLSSAALGGGSASALGGLAGQMPGMPKSMGTPPTPKSGSRFVSQPVAAPPAS